MDQVREGNLLFMNRGNELLIFLILGIYSIYWNYTTTVFYEYNLSLFFLVFSFDSGHFVECGYSSPMSVTNPTPAKYI